MKKTRIEAIIEKTEEGYGVYLSKVEGFAGYGKTEDEAKEELRTVIDEYIEYCVGKKIAIEPEFNNGNVDFEYKYDFSGFFEKFKFINATELANAIGINSSLLRQYKTGKAVASAKKKQEIEQGIHKLAHSLLTVKF